MTSSYGKRVDQDQRGASQESQSYPQFWRVHNLYELRTLQCDNVHVINSILVLYVVRLLLLYTEWLTKFNEHFAVSFSLVGRQCQYACHIVILRALFLL